MRFRDDEGGVVLNVTPVRWDTIDWLHVRFYLTMPQGSWSVTRADWNDWDVPQLERYLMVAAETPDGTRRDPDVPDWEAGDEPSLAFSVTRVESDRVTLRCWMNWGTRLFWDSPSAPDDVLLTTTRDELRQASRHIAADARSAPRTGRP